MALDEATTALLKAMAAGGAKPLHEQIPHEVRAATAAQGALFGPGPAVHDVRDHAVAVDAGTVTVRAYTPADPVAVIVYFHGGGWALGTLDEFDALARTLADRTGAEVLSVGYRLAPEHRYPTAPRDAWAALRWADARITERGTPLPLVVAGDSSGGNLAAVVTQRARSEGGPRIAAQVLAYPPTDCDLDNASYTDPANQLTLTRDTMAWFWNHYADPEQRTNPDASPLRAADLSGLPPAVVLTAEYDPLRDEGEAYAEKLRAAGVPVAHRRFTGQVHGFFSMVGVLPGAADAMDFVVEQLAGLLVAGPATD
ncbi:alpha/beta hydrolase [Streptomyces sp. NPDC050433]|uniref:alpha/beta hydrolase n=1 Tax=Streptomyces sp. NPDC050433 TaxID=3365615 RepID=UPI003791249F